MFNNQYEEHLAHSTDDGSRWDGFDRGDTDSDVIGRMRGKYERVQIIENWHTGFGSVFEVWVDDSLIMETVRRHEAIETARSWL